MADFPTSVVSMTNPVPTDTLASPSHSEQHADINDEVEAIEGFILDRWMDVRSFGATGDGLTDDTTAIQNAIDATPAGDTLFFPRGVYLFSTLSITASLQMRSDGWHCNPQAEFGNADWDDDGEFGGCVLRSTATSGDAIAMNAANANFGIHNMVIVGPGSGTSTGVHIGSAANFSLMSHFENVLVANFHRGWYVQFVLDSNFIGVRSRGCKTGFHLNNASNQNTWLNTEVQFSDTDAILLEASTANLFSGGLLQNISGTSGVRLVDSGCSLNTFANFYAEPTTTPTALIHQVDGSQNRYRDWWISTTGQTVRFQGGGQNVAENLRQSGSGTIQIDGGATWTGVLFPSGFTITDNGGKTFLLSTADELMKLTGDIRIPSGKKFYFETVGTGNALYRDTGNGDTVIGAGSDCVRIDTKTVKTNPGATGARPTAASVGAGAMYYDNTLNQPIWSDGTNWHDATGTNV